jgi:hypothetical protein
MSKLDLLTEDTLNPSDQKFVCVSFLTDPDNKSSLSGVKIRGVFDSFDSACAHAKKLQSVDPYFNVFVGDVGKWLPFDPNPDSQLATNSEYANEQLNTMMKAYMENQEKAKLFHEHRKQELVRENILESLDTRRKNLAEVGAKLAVSKNGHEKESLGKSVQEIEKQIQKMEEKKAELDQQLSNLSAQLGSYTQTNKNANLTGPAIIPQPDNQN